MVHTHCQGGGEGDVLQCRDDIGFILHFSFNTSHRIYRHTLNLSRRRRTRYVARSARLSYGRRYSSKLDSMRPLYCMVSRLSANCGNQSNERGQVPTGASIKRRRRRSPLHQAPRLGGDSCSIESRLPSATKLHEERGACGGPGNRA